MKNIKYNISTALMTIGLLLVSCNELLEPEDANLFELEEVQDVINFAEGILLSAYLDLPTSHSTFNLAYGSDDAVTNDANNATKTVVDGGWTSNVNPFGTWDGAYESILYINTFLEEMSEIEWWWRDEDINDSYSKRLVAEAYGLRAWYYFQLLQAHAGEGTNGEMLGVPIVDHVLDVRNPNDYQIPRSSFNDLVEFILNDCDLALADLPDRYIDTEDYSYDEPLGSQYTNRINGLAVRLIKAKTLLYAASPAYSDGTYTYQMAAEELADIMILNNGLGDVTAANSDHLEFYNNANVADPEAGNEHPEVFWYSRREEINSWEAANYPPSWFGSGRTNPTQNLVNAFPMSDGTPVTDTKINSSDPYSDRDPRLSLYVIYNGLATERGTLNTLAGSQDAVDSDDPGKSLTGYYLRKFMNLSEVDLTSGSTTTGTHYYTYARYTDVLLMFAEAANEAVGPDGVIGSYSARLVINAIRDRAGITSTAYVDGLGQTELADLIKNERRLEMCFENQRFWDLRRWEMTSEMNEPVNGVSVTSDTDGLVYDYFQAENRSYESYQIHGPIPFNETLKYDIVQNQGW